MSTAVASDEAPVLFEERAAANGTRIGTQLVAVRVKLGRVPVTVGVYPKRHWRLKAIFLIAGCAYTAGATSHFYQKPRPQTGR